MPRFRHGGQKGAALHRLPRYRAVSASSISTASSIRPRTSASPYTVSSQALSANVFQFLVQLSDGFGECCQPVRQQRGDRVR